MNPDLHPNTSTLTFKSQVEHLTSFIPTVPPSLLPKLAPNATRTTLVPPPRGQDVRVVYDLANSQEQQLRVQQKCVEVLTSRISRALEKHALFIKKHKPFLSYYQRLPPEIWAMIFEEATLADETRNWGRIFLNAHKAMAPLSLSHVCSEWRRLSLQTPALWTTLRLRVDDEFSDRTAILLNAFLVRGRNEPLALFLHFKETKKSMSVVNDSGQYQYLQPLFEQHLRWHTVDLCIPISLLRSSFFPIDDVPLLMKFRLKVLPSSTDGVPNPPAMPRTLIRKSPLLSHLILENFLYRFTEGPIQDMSRLFDWNNVTTVCICDPEELPLWVADEDFGMEQAKSLLSVASSLKSWTWILSYGLLSANPYPRILHPHLQSAQLLMNDSDMLDYLELPALKSLTLTIEKLNTASSEIIRSFLQRSPNLEKVQFQGWTSGLLQTLESVGLPLKEVTFRCFSSPNSPSFPSAISVLNRDNIPTLEKVTLLLRPDIDCEYDISASVVETGRQLALDAESRGHPTRISFVAYSDELEEVVNEALNNLEELALANLEISRVHFSL